MRAKFNFDAVGIDNTTSLSVQLPKGSSFTQDLQLPRAPLMEELSPASEHKCRNVNYLVVASLQIYFKFVLF